MFFDFLNNQKFKGGALIKFIISMLPNLAETLHRSAKLKDKQVAKIWSLKLNKQRFGTTMQFPECLEDSSFKTKFGHLDQVL